jgi:WD40 domain-containing protein
MMKHTKKVNALAGLIVLMTVFCVGVRLHTMEPLYPSKSRRLIMPAPYFAEATKGRQSERYKSKLIWVKTSDNIRMELPQWQIDQMKAVQHKGEGTQYHWVDAPMITSDELALVRKALNVSDNLEKFRQFYANLSEKQKGILINAASKLEMQGLTSLLMTYTFPEDVQKQMGATTAQVDSIIAPVVDYLDLKMEVGKEILKGHTNKVRCVAYSPNGNYIVSGSGDNNLILWNGRTGEQIKILKGHSAMVQCVAYSPDGNYIVSGSHDNNLILWDGKTGDQIKILKDHTDIVRCVAYSPDGNCIVSGSKDNSLILWNGKTGDKIKVLEGHIDNINWHFHGVICVAYSPDSNYIVSGAYDKNLILWNGKTGEQIKVLEGHREMVDCVAYSPDGDYIVSGSADAHLILWNGRTGDQIKIFLQEHEDTVYCVVYSPDGDYIVSGSGGGNANLILWNGRTGDQIKILEGHIGVVQCVAYSPDGNYIVSGSRDSNLILWDGKNGKKIDILKGHKGGVNCVVYSPNGNYIVSGSWTENNLILWKLINDQIDYIATQLNIAQARFLHRLYIAQKNEEPVILDTKDVDYQIYLTLPQDVQKVVKEFLPFKMVFDIAEKTLQGKMNELRSSLFYTQSYFFGKTEKTHDQKIKALKDAMQKVEKDSVDYKACVRLLDELELEEAFEVD